ncbi:MAG: hypothetical protein WDZ49_08855 [Litorilinea sp.]
MTTFAIRPARVPDLALTWLGKAWRFNRLLTIALIFQMLLIPFILVGMWLDPKTILGAPAWNKPLKFALSGAIYGGTFLWLLTYIRGRHRWVQRWVQLAANATAIALIGEQLLINLQVIRGVPSHFNAGTPLDATIFSIMGVLIFTLSAFNLLLAIGLLIQGLPNPTFAWAIRFGVLAAFAAMMVGALMSGNITAAQQADFAAQGMSSMVGAHSVGVEMGGPGLPFLGWSTVGGDLRVAHFVGLHGMQALPLLAGLLALPASRRRFAAHQRTGFVLLGGVSYLAWTGLLTWQALRGVSVVTLDGPTALAYLALAGFVLVGSLLIIARGNQPAQSSREVIHMPSAGNTP